MINRSLAALVFSTAVLAFSQANAAVVFSVSSGPTAPFTATSTETFSTQTVGSAPVSDSFASYSTTGTAGVVAQGNTPLVSAAPTGVTGNYLAVTLADQETITLNTPTGMLGLYWGSIDPTNQLVLTLAGGSTFTLTGAQLAAFAGVSAGGTVSEYVTFDSTLAIDSLSLTTNTNSFEVTNIASAVPEVSTWAMLLLGFAGVGFMSYGRRARSASIRLA